MTIRRRLHMINSSDCGLAKMHQWVTVAGCLLLWSSILFFGARTGEGSTFSPLPDPTYSHELPLPILPVAEKVRQIIYPVVGFPALVVAGETLTAVVSTADGGETRDWAMQISTHDRVSQTYTLGNVTSRYDSAAGCYRIEGNYSSRRCHGMFLISSFAVKDQTSLTGSPTQ